MYKVQVDVPATITNLGVGLHTLGVSLSLHTRIEVFVRQDGDLRIVVEGEGAEHIPTDFKNPVLRAATKVFQAREMAPAGMDIHIYNDIPMGVGLDAQAALVMGGLVAANNLIAPDYKRNEILTMARDLGLSQISALSTLMGGLNVCFMGDDGAQIYDSLEPPPLRVVVIVPDVPDYQTKIANALPENVRLDDAVYNLGRLMFLINALTDGDYELLNQTLRDRLYLHAFTQHIPGYAQAVQAAYDEGAAAVTLASFGPAVIAFAPYNHQLIADAMLQAFMRAGAQECRFWTPNLDSQGITISVAS